jgi:hypothetical protein
VCLGFRVVKQCPWPWLGGVLRVFQWNRSDYFFASVWGITASLHHPRRDKMKYHLSLFSPPTLLSRCKEIPKSRRLLVRVHSVSRPVAGAEPEAKPPLALRSSHGDLARCAGLWAVGTRGWNPSRVDLFAVNPTGLQFKPDLHFPFINVSPQTLGTNRAVGNPSMEIRR